MRTARKLVAAHRAERASQRLPARMMGGARRTDIVYIESEIRTVGDGLNVMAVKDARTRPAK